jgi:putative addiction module component (TIGR02574 family)
VDRALLAEHLLASVDVEREVEIAWADEIERRLADVEAGTVPLVSAESAIERARQALS